MSKLSRHIDLALAPRAPGQPLHRELYAERRRAIVEGRLRPGARLPSSRSLAQQQAVARTTVVSIFEQLRIEGDLTSRTGSGTVVAAQLSDQFIQAGPPRRTGRVANAGGMRRGDPRRGCVHECFRSASRPLMCSLWPCGRN